MTTVEQSMRTMRWPLQGGEFDEANIAEAAAIVRAGGLVAMPTETVYGLAAHGLVPEAVRRIFFAKGRPSYNPIILHVSSLEQAKSLVSEWPVSADRLAGAFWPGPLTLVLPKGELVPDVVTAGGLSVAIRFPDHPVARRLIELVGAPLAAPSANRSTELSPTRAEHVLASLSGRIDGVLDAGATRGGIESTVVDVCTESPRVLRPGLLSLTTLQEVIPNIHMAQAVSEATHAQVYVSPGMMARHYAPRTPLILAVSDGLREAQSAIERGATRIGLLRFQDTINERTSAYVTVNLSRKVEIASAKLYDCLHNFDEQGVDVIIVEAPPNTPEWLAVRDRLQRASKLA